MLNLFEDSSKDDLREMYSSYIQSKKDGTKCKEFVSYGKRYRREMGAEQIMPLSTAIDIVESMFFKEIAVLSLILQTSKIKRQQQMKY